MPLSGSDTDANPTTQKSWCFCKGVGKSERMKATIFSGKGPAMASISGAGVGGGETISGTGFLIQWDLLRTTHVILPSVAAAEVSEIRLQDGVAANLVPHGTQEHFLIVNPMKHIVKIMTLLVTISAFWIGLLQMSVVPHSYTWLLPIYFIVSLGCYGLLMVGVGLMNFPTCPQEALLLQQDVIEAKEFLKPRGVDVGSD